MEAMELIRRYFSQIKAQLTGLTISQKLLIGLLALVMIATVFFTVVFSAKPQMVTLFAQPMTPEQINKVDMEIKGKYDYQISGDKILVPTEKLYEIQGLLAEHGAIPEDMRTAIGDMIANSSPFVTERMNGRAYTNAVQVQLGMILRNFSYVSSASVIIAEGEQPTLGRQPMPTTASVYVKTKENKDLSQNQVVAIVDLAAGSFTGLRKDSVSVIANGMRTYHAPSGDTAMSADLLDYKKSMEDHYMQRLAEFFREVGDVKIAVNVVPDLSTKHATSHTYDKPVGKEVQNSNHQIESSEGAGVGGEPGVTLNTSVAAGDNNGSGGKRTATSNVENSSRSELRFGDKVEEITVPAGVETKEITASLSFPRSYFVSIFRRQKNDAKAEPQDADLTPIIDEKLKAMALQAKAAIGLKSDDQLRVDWYDDMLAVRQPELILAGGNGGGLGGFGNITQYAKQGMLAVVAIGALGMMLMMVRRAVPAGGDGETDTGVFFGGKGKRKGSAVEQLDAADDVFGEANQGEAVLTGIELDDETLQSRKMVDEVSTMIKENPENAAALVKRWMTKSK
jgi:flagellar biosynthesis/type III secretory pathway M-ring protein FliF/YscJ